ERQVHEHRDQQDLNCLPGLIEHGTCENADQIWIGDCYCERRILCEVQIIACKRWNNDAHCLRKDDKTQYLSWAEAERPSRLLLALRNTLYSGTHDLGNVRSGIEDETTDEGDEFRQDDYTTLEIEALQFRVIQR